MSRPTNPVREAAPADLPRTTTLPAIGAQGLPSAHWAALSPEIFEYTEHQNMLKPNAARAHVRESDR